MFPLPPHFRLGAAFLGVALLTWGCATPQPDAAPQKTSYRAVPTPTGVRLTSEGAAVIEVETSAEPLFGRVEERVRKEYRVTFINHDLRWIEGETRTRHLTVQVRSLTTGKAGLSVAFRDRKTEKPLPEASAELAAELAAASTPLPPKPTSPPPPGLRE